MLIERFEIDFDRAGADDGLASQPGVPIDFHPAASAHQSSADMTPVSQARVQFVLDIFQHVQDPGGSLPRDFVRLPEGLVGLFRIISANIYADVFAHFQLGHGPC